MLASGKLIKRDEMMKRSYLKLIKYFGIRHPKTPIQLIHFVTSKCNAKCGHCFYWKNLNTQGELSLEEIEKLSKKLPDLVILNISGGEPFLRPDFAEVIKTYYRNTPVKEVSVPTNGTFTKKILRDCTNILDNCPGMDLNIVFSLDGPEDIHDEIRKVKDCYKKAETSLKELKQLQSKYKHLQVSVVACLTSLNQNRLEEFHETVKKDMDPDVFSMNLIRGEAKKMDLFGVDIDNYKKWFTLENESKKKGIKPIIRDFMNKIRTEVIIRNVEKKEYVLPCRAGTLMGVMYEKGDIYPCELLNDKPLGNIKDFDYDFQKLWHSAENKACNTFIKESKCYCTHECFLRFNILYNPKFMIKSMVRNFFGLVDIKPKNQGPQMPASSNDGSTLIKIGEIRGVRNKEDGPAIVINA
jgi:MoaA/NifB/PqqE/SkfB family radical SAM enzyme